MSRVQSIQRAFAILRQLASQEMGITEMAGAVGLPKSTVARLLKTLELEGAVERVGSEGRYRIGPAVTGLAGDASRSVDLVGRVRPQLSLLVREIGEDAGFSVPDGHRVLYVVQVDSDNAVQVRDWTDEAIPMHAVPSGLVILAHWPPEALDRFLAGRLVAFTDSTVTEPGAVRDRLQEIRRSGYAWVFEEFAEGINSVAAAILDGRGRPVGAIHVHGPAYRFPGDRNPGEIAALVAEKANILSGQLGTLD